MSTEGRARAWIEIEGASLRRNAERIRNAVGQGPDLIPMVKADAYGLGAGPVVRALEPLDPWGYGVATVEEGRAIRALGIERPVLVFSPTPSESVGAAVREDLTLTLSDLDTLGVVREAAERWSRAPAFHVEIDTGMGRSGFDWREARTWGKSLLARAGRERWTGCFTHFHSADVEDVESVRMQWRRFQDALAALPVSAESMKIHACNSAAALRTPEYAADAVRPGIFLYGGTAGQALPEPERVVSVRARVVLVRDMVPGSTTGYGATHRAGGLERWATVAIGYGDGLPRALSNRGSALVHGRRVPVIGRISMDMTVVDITDVPEVAPGDVVTFVGSDGGKRISLEEVADLAGTIHYEILTGFTPRLPRVWLDQEGA